MAARKTAPRQERSTSQKHHGGPCMPCAYRSVVARVSDFHKRPRLIVADEHVDYIVLIDFLSVHFRDAVALLQVALSGGAREQIDDHKVLLHDAHRRLVGNAIRRLLLCRVWSTTVASRRDRPRAGRTWNGVRRTAHFMMDSLPLDTQTTGTRGGIRACMHALFCSPASPGPRIASNHRMCAQIHTRSVQRYHTRACVSAAAGVSRRARRKWGKYRVLVIEGQHVLVHVLEHLVAEVFGLADLALLLVRSTPPSGSPLPAWRRPAPALRLAPAVFSTRARHAPVLPRAPAPVTPCARPEDLRGRAG